MLLCILAMEMKRPSMIPDIYHRDFEMKVETHPTNLLSFDNDISLQKLHR